MCKNILFKYIEDIEEWNQTTISRNFSKKMPGFGKLVKLIVKLNLKLQFHERMHFEFYNISV